MKRIGTVVIVVLILIFSYMVYDFVSYRSKNAVSDAAFVRSDTLSQLGFKVGGKVVEVAKREGEPVQKDEVIARLDATDFLLAKKRLQKEMAALQKEIEALAIKKEKVATSIVLGIERSQNSKKSLSLKVESLKHQIAAAKSQLQKLAKDTKRFENLLAQKLVAKADFERIKTQKDMLTQKIAALQKELASAKEGLKNASVAIAEAKNAQKTIKELALSIEALATKRHALGKELEMVEKKIGYCNLKAPFSGAIAKRFVNVGQVVSKGSPIYAIVDPSKLHIEVLLSEKKLRGVKPGNDVKIKVDAFKDRTYEGIVEKILPASAATFSLVPRDIASGEFTKLDQRFIVRIRIKNPTPDLRVGMGASVAIKRN